MKAKQNKTIELTKESYDSLQEELQDLESNQLPAVIDRIAKAREQGDLSENSEYKDAKDQQELLEVRIGEIQEILAKAVIIKESKSTSQVGIGSSVTLQNDSGKKITYEIVGEFDKTAVDANTISAVSPIGRAVIGKKTGDKVEVEVPAGVRKFKIVSIK